MLAQRSAFASSLDSCLCFGLFVSFPYLQPFFFCFFFRKVPRDRQLHRVWPPSATVFSLLNHTLPHVGASNVNRPPVSQSPFGKSPKWVKIAHFFFFFRHRFQPAVMHIQPRLPPSLCFFGVVRLEGSPDPCPSGESRARAAQWREGRL